MPCAYRCRPALPFITPGLRAVSHFCAIIEAMATWDGSYPEDLNYLVDAAYLSAYLPAGSYYPGSGSGPAATFYQVDAQHPSNMVPLENNAYQERALPNDARAAPGDVAAASRNAAPHGPRGGGYKPRQSRGNRAAGKHAAPPPSSAGDVVQSTVVENSNLHPMASEFVPNSQQVKSFRRDSRHRRYDNGNATGTSGFNAYAQEFRPKPADKSSMDNRYRNERRYDNRRDANYRQKRPQDTQAPRSGYRDTQRTYNARNYNKFQNGRYYNRKYQLDAEQSAAGEAQTFTAEAADSTTSSSQENKAVTEEMQEDDSVLGTKTGRRREESSTYEDTDSENVSSKILEAQRNGRPKRFANASSYYRYNSDDMQFEPAARRKTVATTARYPQRRNEMASYREKKVENWRDRMENNERTQAPQGKNPKKKYDIGTFIYQRDYIVIIIVI